MVEIEQIARVVVGTSRDHWVRRGAEWVFAAKTEFGSAAPKLEEELAILASEVKSLLSARSAPDGALRTAAYYHLRFAAIHPLFDGNGRVGRVLMAMQCSQSYGIPVAEILGAIDDSEIEYRSIHRSTRESAFRYELLLDLLSRLLAVPVEGEIKLPFRLEPRFPDRRSEAGLRVAIQRKQAKQRR